MKITITVDEHTRAVLDALAFLHDFRGASPRATMLREMVINAAAAAYAKDGAVKELVDMWESGRRDAEARHPTRHLRAVPDA